MNNEKPRLWTRNFVLIIVINFLVFMTHIMLLSTFPFYIESLGGSEALAGLAEYRLLVFPEDLVKEIRKVLDRQEEGGARKTARSGKYAKTNA